METIKHLSSGIVGEFLLDAIRLPIIRECEFGCGHLLHDPFALFCTMIRRRELIEQCLHLMFKAQNMLLEGILHAPSAKRFCWYARSMASFLLSKQTGFLTGVLLATWFGPLHRFNLAQPWNVVNAGSSCDKIHSPEVFKGSDLLIT